MLRGTKIAGTITLLAAVGLIAFYAGKGNAKSIAQPEAKSASPIAEAAQAEIARQISGAPRADAVKQDAHPQPRSGGKLTAREMDAIKTETKAAAAHQEITESLIKSWTAKDPGPVVIEREAARIARVNAAANLRSTLLLRRIAAEHDLAFECFVGVVNDAGRKQCAERLWAFDGKTGEISLAPKDPPK